MGQQLEDVKPRRVSLVKRGANLRRILLAKADEENLDATVADMLQAPVAKEDRLLDAIRASEGDESVEKAGSTVARALDALRTAYDGQLPDEVRKAIDAMSDCDPDNDDDDDGDDPNDEDDDGVVAKAHEEIVKDFTDEQRQDMARKGQALPDGSYPIPNTDYLKRAIHAVGRGKNNPKQTIRDHIVTRAKALGATDLLPDSWNIQKEDGMTETAQAVPVKKEDGSWDLSAVPEDAREAVEAVLKAHDDELAELRKENEAEKSKADEAIEIAKAERETRETREFIAKSAELAHLAKDDDEFGPVLKVIAGAERDGHLPDGTAAKLDEVLKAADEAVSKGDLFKTIGRAGHTAGDNDAETQIDAAASELRKSDPKLTKEQAVAKALEDNPDLYAAYMKERV